MIRSLRSHFVAGPGQVASPSWWGLVAGLAHAVLLAAALPPFDVWPLTFLAILPLVLAAELRWAHPGRAAACVYLGSLLFWGYEQAWTWPVSEIGYIPLVLYLTIFPWLFFVLERRARARLPRLPLWLTASVLWVGLEVLRGEVVWGGYAWALIAHPVIDSRWLSSPAAVLGQYLVSFLVAVCSAGLVAVFLGWIRSRKSSMAGGLAAIGGSLAVWTVCAAIQPGPGDARPVVVGVVQTNVPQSNKMSATIDVEIALWETLSSRSAWAAESGAQVIIWPETMKPGMTLDAESVENERRAALGYRIQGPDGSARNVASTVFVDELLDLQSRLGVPIVVGEDAFRGLHFIAEDGGYRAAYDQRFNSVFVVENGAVSPTRYDKVHLTPFGEQMPYIEAIPWLKKQLLALAARNMKLDLSAGAGPVTLEPGLNDGRILRMATPICFEVTDGRLCRKMVASGGARRAEVLVNLTNDGWFGTADATREQHLQIARWRARELATPVIRAANTGISAAIDAEGQLIPRIDEPGSPAKLAAPARQEGQLIREVRPGGPLTIYARVGDVFTWSSLAAAVVLTILTAFKRPGPIVPAEGT